MAHRTKTNQSVKQLAGLLTGLLLALIVFVAFIGAASNHLEDRSLTLSNSQPGVTAVYKFSFRPVALDAIQTIQLQICANDPFPGKPCTAPAGFDASGANLISESGDVGFGISGQSTANEIILERSPFASNAQLNSYILDNIVNPSAEGTYYVRIQTFDGNDLSAEANNYGGLAFAINKGVDINAVVPPYLLFCVGVTVAGFDCENVSGNFVDFGEFSSRQASQGSTQMLAASNAKDGHNIRLTGTTLTSGNNVIPGMSASDISRPGVSQFGLNLRANNAPTGGGDVAGTGTGVAAPGYNQINFYRFNPGEVVAASSGPDEARKYTVAYIVNINRNQAPGIYVSTLTYIALGSY